MWYYESKEGALPTKESDYDAHSVVVLKGLDPVKKQKGEALAAEMGCSHRKGEDPTEWPEDICIQEFPEAISV